MRLVREVRLLDLRGAWPTRAGASQAISSGPRPRAQSWARAIRSAFPHLDGLAYPSSMRGGGVAVALFDAAADALPDAPEGAWRLDHPALAGPLARIAQDIGYIVI